MTIQGGCSAALKCAADTGLAPGGDWCPGAEPCHALYTSKAGSGDTRAAVANASAGSFCSEEVVYAGPWHPDCVCGGPKGL